MNDRIRTIYNYLLKRDYRNLRSNEEYNFSKEFKDNNVAFPTRSAENLYRYAKLEKPILIQEDRIGFRRYIKVINPWYTDDEFKELNKNHFIFDQGVVGNISSDYETTLNVGFDARLQEINETLKNANEKQTIELNAMKRAIEAVYVIADKYKEAAKENNKELYNALCNVPRNKPKTFFEATVMLRIMNFMLWLNRNKHNTLGRFDQYMYPFYKNDIDNKVIDEEQALEIIEEFFLSVNFDADLYPGIQQGDNGQSLVLGGCDENGNDAYNDLSRLCLQASEELCLIDPKINMRVNKNTSDYWYESGTKLTKKGLGFPQYSNDDIVIPSLVKWGYDLKDARNYVVAACWEFIIPNVAMDIPNVDAINFPELVNNVVNKELKDLKSYEEFEAKVKEYISVDVKRMVDLTNNLYIFASPFQSILMEGYTKTGKDISEGSKYNNLGIHGAGISNASDAMAAVKKYIFDEKSISVDELLKALDANFVGYESLQKKLIDAPKMGNNEDYVDNIACMLTDTFSKECLKHTNCRGGIVRAGTGTAMYYIWWSERLKATADGRKAFTPFAANYSPSLNTNMKGVLSVIQSFTKPDLQKVCNGGPLTLEFHDTLFRNEEGSQKVAKLVKTYITLGGHQLQLNAVNRDVLLDAQKHPEDHKNLIVRVWGWSGYFNELDLVYQNHIISRLEFLA